MRFPWISRGSHFEMVAVLKAQISEMSEERKLLLDRLATLGLGGPLFHTVAGAETLAVEESASDLDVAAAELEQLTRLRRRPSQLADALTRKAHRDQYKSPAAVRVSRVASGEAVQAALDKADAGGKHQA